ncbi:MAG: efflux transporter outer membrane subunit [Burkholderiales bacterium]|nr:efflux transporter outer membrane subunit [Burkholderiales bacterium]
MAGNRIVGNRLVEHRSADDRLAGHRSADHRSDRHRAAAAALLFTLTLLAGGCTVMGPDYQRPAVNLPADFGNGEAATAAADTMIPADWWRRYGDAELDALVDSVFASNTDLRLAAAQLEEAEAVLRETYAVLYPQLNLDAASTRSRVTTRGAQPIPAGIPVVRWDQRAAFSTSFELDFWGRLRRGAEAAQAQLLATQYGKDVVQLGLAGTAVQAYFLLRSLDAQIAVTRDSLAAREESLAVARARARGGLASELDVYQAEGLRADAAVQLNDLQRQRAAVERQLGVLSGRLDLRVASGDLRALPVPPTPPVGLPSSLLDRRPDVRQAEAALAAANARIGVAKAAMRPTISLTGMLGGQSRDLSDLLSAGARIWSLGVGLSLPIFDAGRLQARTDQAEARERQALAAYQKSTETAFREVADALNNIERSAAAEQQLDVRLQAARNTVRLARLRYEAGYSAYLEVLDALRNQNDAELAMVRNRQARLAYSVDLMKALGGGWTASEPAPLPLTPVQAVGKVFGASSEPLSAP